ncbi:hypothetical protein M3J09_013786 [Ascochyta lentis]
MTIEPCNHACPTADHPTMPRSRGPPRDEIQATLLNDLQESDTMIALIQLTIHTAKEREALKAARDAAYQACSTSNGGLDKLNHVISRKQSLEEARSDSQEDVKMTADTIN